MSKTSIEWTEDTWNPVRGCSRVSEGCRHCYAESIASRFSGPGLPFEGYATRERGWTGKVSLIPEKLREPLTWKKPRRVFVNSMSDLFHEGLGLEQIMQVLAHAVAAGWMRGHVFQILTKRAERMAEIVTQRFWDQVIREAEKIVEFERVALDTGSEAFEFLAAMSPVPRCIWMGVSVEDQDRVHRVDELLKVPAAVHFVSAEPLLGLVDIRKHLIGHEEPGTPFSNPPTRTVGGCASWTPPVDWVIVGGESGRGARPMHPDWARSIRDQCVAAGVPYFFKQWGEWSPDPTTKPMPDAMVGLDGRLMVKGDEAWIPDMIAAAPMARVGKKRAGRLLDGLEWSEFPEVRS